MRGESDRMCFFVFRSERRKVIFHFYNGSVTSYIYKGSMGRIG